MRSKVIDALEAHEAREQGQMRRVNKNLKFVREQFLLAAATQNIQRVVRFFGQSQD